MFMRISLCLCLSVATTPLMADTVWMKNGDRLTGIIRVFDSGKLMLETPYGGSVPLDWKQVATLQSDRELLVKENDMSGERTKSLKAAESGKVILANGDAPKTVELASIQQIMKPKPLVEDFMWKGNVDVAMDYKRAENNTDDYHIALKTQARHGTWRHNATLDYNRELRDDIVSTDNWRTVYALDRFLDEQWFWQGRLEYKRDKVEDLEVQRTLGTGPGYQFWDNELGAFSIAGLVNRSDYQYISGEKDNFYAISMHWDYNRYLVGKTFELFSTGDVGKPLASAVEYALDAEVGLRYKVTEWASLNLKASKDQVSSSEGNKDETRYTIGIGVGW